MKGGFPLADFRILTDSSCDLPQQLVDELDLTVLNLIFYNEKTQQQYENFLDWHEIGVHDFFEQLRGGEVYKTSAVNTDAFISIMEPILQGGEDLLYLGFSSGLSGTYNAGAMAAQELSAKYPDRKIYTVDSLCASLGQGLFVYHVVQEKRKGKTIEEVRDYAEDIKLHLCHQFTVDDLMFLKRGGRISAATALVGTMLGIKPVLHVDFEGHLINIGKARGRKASIKALVDKMGETGVDLADQTVFICNGDCEEDAKFAADMIRQRFGVKDILIHPVGPVIGSHSGPGTLALFYLGNDPDRTPGVH